MEDLTPKQVARALGVSESSLKRWCDQGLIATVRTAGGHRRLPRAAVLEFLRASGRALPSPELLGLPATTGHGPRVLHRAAHAALEALAGGNEAVFRSIVFDLYLSGQRVGAICDEVIAEAFHRIGDRWECGDLDVFQERRSCEICTRVLHDLRAALPAPAADAPLAIGGAWEEDPYTLPTLMVEMTLRQCGWRAVSLGARLPFVSLAAALREYQPRLFWLSVSHIDDADRFLAEYADFYERHRGGAAVVVGGQALSESLRRRMRYAAFCDNLQHLEAFAATLQPAA